MGKLDQLRAYKNEIRRIAEAHRVVNLFVFGSCVRREDTPGSDIDFIAEFGPGASAFNHIDLEYQLSKLLNASVDVVSLKVLKDDAFGKRAKLEMIQL